jgi:hypothetical protein
MSINREQRRLVRMFHPMGSVDMEVLEGVDEVHVIALCA